jgi:starch-binding outer membrane protein SusE/F
MKRKILLQLFFILLSSISFAQTISLVGDTSPSGSWSVDTYMSTTDNISYTLNNAVLTSATGPSTGLKFRQDGGWTTNWGGSTFPSGTGILNGPNIQTVAGTYNITFNRLNGTYTFIQISGFPSVGIWGPAVDSQNGYAGPDVDMATNDGVNYILNGFNFSSGNAYFRQDDNGTLVWGSTTFPSGTAVSNGPSLFIPGGEWSVTFNRSTGAYSFMHPSIGILGSALPNGFSGPDTDLATTDGFIYTISNLTMTDGLVKFRKDDNWNVNWGSVDFPTGTGVQNGNDIPVTAGTYTISFDRTTGAYQFDSSLNSFQFSNSNFSIYPNPSQNNWTIVSENIIKHIELTDLLGKTIGIEEPNSLDFLLNGTALNKGIYFVKISTNNGNHTLKLVKN